MTWVKICGITNLEDAKVAVEAGADALGFVFYEKSPRNIDPETARRIVAELPANSEKVGVFVDEPAQVVLDTVKRVGLTAVQLYDKDCAETLAANLDALRTRSRLRPKIIFVVPGDQFAASGGMNLLEGAWMISKSFRDILFAVLVDSSSDSQPGGTGRPFDWTRARAVIPTMGTIRPTIVAGGLAPSNVQVALTVLQHPWGVDVSSGVEAKPGKKDPEKVRAFIKAVRDMDEKYGPGMSRDSSLRSE
jgi:phosphoribosylanthranilate isomerase